MLILHYLKDSSFVNYVSLDDIAVIPEPASCGVRGHNRSIVLAEGPKLSALDHDFHVYGIVPSVYVIRC